MPLGHMLNFQLKIGRSAVYLQSDHLYSISLRSTVYGTAMSLKDLDFKKFCAGIIMEKLALFCCFCFLSLRFFCFALFFFCCCLCLLGFKTGSPYI